MKTFRWPDRPGLTISPEHLESISADEYFATLKLDGWRLLVERHRAKFSYLSRENKPMPIRDEVRFPFEAFVNQHFQGDTILDCELTGNRRTGDAKAIVILDILMENGVAFYHAPALDRITAKDLPGSYLVPYAFGNLKGGWRKVWQDWQGFSSVKGNPPAEGIVFRRKDSRYIGSPVKAAENPGWIRCKWRSGSDGLAPTEIL